MLYCIMLIQFPSFFVSGSRIVPDFSVSFGCIYTLKCRSGALMGKMTLSVSMPTNILCLISEVMTCKYLHTFWMGTLNAASPIHHLTF